MTAKLLVKSKEYKLTDGITQSMMQSFLACRQRSRFSLDRWESTFGGNASATRGDLFHCILEHHYKTKMPMHEIIAAWQKKQNRMAANLQDLDDAENFAIAVFPEYLKFYQSRDAKFKWESLEEVFDVQYKGYRLRGKFDGVLTLNGKRWLFETKTKAQIDQEGIEDSLAFDFQNLFYLTALKTMSRPAVGVIYNIVRYPQLRIKKTESAEEYQERIRQDVKDRRTHYFYRYEVPYSQKTRDAFEAELYLKLQDFELWISGEIPTYKNETACITRMKCGYIKACASCSMAGYKQTRVLFRELQA